MSSQRSERSLWYRARLETALETFKAGQIVTSSPICRELIFDPATPNGYRAWAHLLLAMTDGEELKSVLYHATIAERMHRQIEQDAPGNAVHKAHLELAERVLAAAQQDAQERYPVKNDQNKQNQAVSTSTYRMKHSDRPYNMFEPLEDEEEASSIGASKNTVEVIGLGVDVVEDNQGGSVAAPEDSLRFSGLGIDLGGSELLPYRHRHPVHTSGSASDTGSKVPDFMKIFNSPSMASSSRPVSPLGTPIFSPKASSTGRTEQSEFAPVSRDEKEIDDDDDDYDNEVDNQDVGNTTKGSTRGRSTRRRKGKGKGKGKKST